MYCFYCTTHAPFHQSLSCRRERYPDRYCERYPDQRAQEKPGCKRIRVFFGGRGWIRTTEALSSRFTVCPHWPLGNTPLFCFHRAGVLPGDLFILPQALLFVNSFFKLFRSSAPGCRSGRQRAAGPYPVVQPAAPDCLLILAPAGAFVNREFAFWGGIVVS